MHVETNRVAGKSQPSKNRPDVPLTSRLQAAERPIVRQVIPTRLTIPKEYRVIRPQSKKQVFL